MCVAPSLYMSTVPEWRVVFASSGKAVFTMVVEC